MILPGLVSVTFRGLTPARIIALAVEAHLKGIEWGGDIHVPVGNLELAREVGIWTREAGLHVASYGSYYRAGESEKEGLSFPSVLETAQILGAPNIRVWSGRKSWAKADADYRRHVCADLERVAALALDCGITVSCEFHDDTLTDGMESTREVLQTANHPNLKTYWQPRHGKPTEVGLAELAALEPWLTNLHVFQWWPSAAERHPLSAGEERWKRFLARAAQMEGTRYALLEFVREDSPEAFLEDARCLHRLLAA